MDPPEIQVERTRLGGWDVIVVQGRVVDNRPHRHHALQVCWSRGQAAAVRLGDSTVEGKAVIVDGGVTHALRLQSGALCLVPKESPLAIALQRNWLQGRPAVTVPGPLPATLMEFLTLAAATPVGGMEQRVRTVLDWLDRMESQQRWADVTLDGALKQVHLSEDRFRHVWTAAMGTPWRTYLTWRRALVALTLAMAGHSLTETAHRVGYADSAHLSRQVAERFGFSPSHILKVSRFVQGDRPQRA